MLNRIAVLLAFLGYALSPIQAHAWHAIAVADGALPLVFTGTVESRDQETAKANALGMCQTNKRLSCRIIGRPFTGEVAVVTTGDGSFGIGYHKDPARALLASRKDCERLSKSCVPIKAVASRILGYAGVAHSESHGFFAFTGANSHEEAEQKVLRNCERISKGKCKIKRLKDMSATAWYVVATSEQNSFQSIQRAYLKQMAMQDAIASCEAATKARCAPESGFAPVWNGPAEYLTDAQRKDLREIELAGRRNFDIAVDRVRSENIRKMGNRIQQPSPQYVPGLENREPCMITHVPGPFGTTSENRSAGCDAN